MPPTQKTPVARGLWPAAGAGALACVAPLERVGTLDGVVPGRPWEREPWPLEQLAHSAPEASIVFLVFGVRGVSGASPGCPGVCAGCRRGGVGRALAIFAPVNPSSFFPL